MPSLLGVHEHVIVLGLNPDDLSCFEHDRTVAVFEREPLEMLWLAGRPRRLLVMQLGGEARDLCGQLAQAAFSHAALRAIERLAKSLVGKRLQYVVSRTDLERLRRVGAECGD